MYICGFQHDGEFKKKRKDFSFLNVKIKSHKTYVFVCLKDMIGYVHFYCLVNSQTQNSKERAAINIL